jgi:SAM-dependent methyltransferase
MPSRQEQFPPQGERGNSPAWSGAQVRESFNGIESIVHYTRAAHCLGLWKSERQVIERFLPGPSTRVLEAGCGAGRATLGLWSMGYRAIHAFDFADELLDQARSLAAEHGAGSILFSCADATALRRADFGLGPGEGFGAALFLFNGLMQIPGRQNRLEALRGLRGLCRAGAPIIFTTHDRDVPGDDGSWWRAEAERWARGLQDPRLTDFGDRRFRDESGEVFIHIPDRQEIIADLSAAGWSHSYDAMRNEIAKEGPDVTRFSDNCRFWVASRAP